METIGSAEAGVQAEGPSAEATLWGSAVQIPGVLGFGVEGLGFGVWGLGFRVWGLGFRV